MILVDGHKSDGLIGWFFGRGRNRTPYVQGVLKFVKLVGLQQRFLLEILKLLSCGLVFEDFEVFFLLFLIEEQGILDRVQQNLLKSDKVTDSHVSIQTDKAPASMVISLLSA